jgi:hypothetical protein
MYTGRQYSIHCIWYTSYNNYMCRNSLHILLFYHSNSAVSYIIDSHQNFVQFPTGRGGGGAPTEGSKFYYIIIYCTCTYIIIVQLVYQLQHAMIVRNTELL